MEHSNSPMDKSIKLSNSQVGTYRNNLWNCLNIQRKEGELCDVVLQCRGEIFHAHSNVLGSVSKFFKTLFLSSLTPSVSKHTVNLDDFPSDIVALLLDIIYTQMDIWYSCIPDLLRLAEFLSFDWLVDILQKEVITMLTDSNIFYWYKVSQEAGCRELASLTESYICENFSKLHWETMKTRNTSCALENIKILSHILSHMPTKNAQCKKVTLVQGKSGIFKSGELYIVDVMEKRFEKYSRGEMLSFWRVNISLLNSIFLRKNAFYLVQERRNKEQGSQSIPDIVISKFLHHSRSLECTYVVKYATMYEKMRLMDFTLWYRYRSVNLERTYYDNKNSLYMLVTERYSSLLRFFKFDLIIGKLYNGYIEIHSDYLHPKMLVLDEGVYLVCKDFICNVDKFDFNDPDNHEIEQERVMWTCQDDVSCVGERYCTYKRINGSGYCVVSKYWESKNVIFILKLDVSNRAWVCVCETSLDFVCNTFICQQKLCFIHEPPSNESDSEYVYGRPFPGILYYFDEDAGVVKKTDIIVPDVYGFDDFEGDGDDYFRGPYFSIPAHLIF